MLYLHIINTHKAPLQDATAQLHPQQLSAVGIQLYSNHFLRQTSILLQNLSSPEQLNVQASVHGPFITITWGRMDYQIHLVSFSVQLIQLKQLQRHFTIIVFNQTVQLEVQVVQALSVMLVWIQPCLDEGMSCLLSERRFYKGWIAPVFQLGGFLNFLQLPVYWFSIFKKIFQFHVSR